MIDVKRAVGKLFRAIAFSRWRSVAACTAFSGGSFVLELRCPDSGLFAASGAIFTLGGFLLNIKQSAIFHRQAADGSVPSTDPHEVLRDNEGFHFRKRDRRGRNGYQGQVG